MCRRHRALLGVAALVIGVLFVLSFPPGHSSAASGINQELSFEGKIVTNSAGINIANGTYNMQFQIYTGCTNNTGSGCTSVWLENWLVGTAPVTFSSGTFQVNLGTNTAFGTSVPWGTNPLYLSIEIGNTSAPTGSGCATAALFVTDCGGDGIMSPYILLTSTPYAFNSLELNGLASSSYGQLAASNAFQPATNVTGVTVLQNTYATPTADIFDVQTVNNTNAIQVTGPSLNNANVVIQSVGAGGTLILGSQTSTQTISIGAVGTASNASTVNLGTTTGATQTINIGGLGGSSNSNSGTNTDIQGGQTDLNVADAGVTVQTYTNTATALQIQNSSGFDLLNANTTSSSVSFDQLSAPGTVTTSLAPAAPTVAFAAGGTTGTATTYKYEVLGVDANGAITYSSPLGTITTGDTSFNNMSTTNYNTVSWTSTGATEYMVYRESNGTTAADIGLIGTTTTTSLEDTGQTASQSVPINTAAGLGSATYYYSVTALDGTGGQTTGSTVVSKAATVATNSAITLSWPAVPGARSYNVYFNSGATLVPGTSYSYFATNTNSFTMTTTTGASSGVLPTTNTAYNSTLSNSATSQITLGDNTGSASSAQLDVTGALPTAAISTVSTGTNGNYPGVTVSGNYAYVVNFYTSGTLQIFDVSNPSAPVLVGTVAVGSTPENVYVSGHYAYVSNTVSDTVQIIDVSNPSSPTVVSTVGVGLSPQQVVVSGRYAYVTNQNSNNIQVIDVSNPAEPVVVATAATDANPQEMVVQGRYLYVTDYGTTVVQVFDISNPLDPVPVGAVTVGANPNSIYVVGRYAYITEASAMQIIDISNPLNPVLAGKIATSTVPDIDFVAGHYAYIANSSAANVQVVDISNPDDPVNIGTIPTSGDTPVQLAVQGRYLYVTNYNGGPGTMQIFDLGGTYTQNLQAGTTDTGTLQVDSNASIGNNLSVGGAVNIAQSLGISGSLSVSGTTSFANSINSTTAFQVQNATGGTVLNVNTASTVVSVDASLQVNGAAAGYSPSVVQQTNGASTGTATAVFTNNTTVGNTLVLMAQVSSATDDVSSVTGAGVGTWQKITAASIDSGGYDTEMWYGDVTSSGSNTITVVESGGGTDSVRLIAAEVYGLISSPVDQANSATYTTTTNPVTPTITTTANSEIIFADAKDGGTGSTYSAPTNGFTDLNAPVPYNAMSYLVTSTTGNYSTGWTASPADTGEVGIVSFKASSTLPDIADFISSTSGTVESINSTGDTTFKNSSNSTSAFQVQNSNGNNILSVNTSTPAVSVGGALDSTGAITASDTAVIQDAGSDNFALAVDNSLGLPVLLAGSNNLIINSDFEGTTSTTGWAADGTGASIAQNTIPSDTYSGSGSLAVTVGTTATVGTQVTSFNQTLSAGTYTLNFYAQSPTAFNMAIAFTGGTATCTLNSAAITTSFSDHYCTFTSTGTITGIEFDDGTNATALTFYLDAIQLTNSPNLLTNPGFELNSTGWATYGTGSTITWNNNANFAYEGIGSLKIVTGTTGNAGAETTAFTTGATLPAGTYTISFDAGDATASFTTLAADVNGTGATCTLSPSPTTTAVPTTGFVRYSCTVTTSTTSSLLYIDSTAATSSTFYIDAVQISGSSTSLPYDIGQIQLRGVIDNPVAFQGLSNSTTAFQIDNASGSSILFNVDTYDGEISINGSAITTVNNQAGVIIGNGYSSSSTSLIPLTLSSSSTYAEAANTCTTTVNDGALYYNSDTNAIRACINGGWEDLASTAGLGIILFGVAPDSGSVPGDIEATSSADVSGPCRVSWASKTTVTIQACVLYSGGRKIVQPTVTVTLPAMADSTFTHLCYWDTGTTSAAGPITNATTFFTTTSTTESANLPTFSANNPVLCIATIKNSTSATNTIAQIFDTRVFTNSTKTFTNSTVALAPGWITIYTTTNTQQVTDTATAATKGIAGVVAVSNGAAWASGGPNVIIVTSGPAEVEALAGTTTAYNYIETGGTAGYATTVTTASTTLTLPNLYLGLALTTFGSCATPSATTCSGSLLTQILWGD